MDTILYVTDFSANSRAALRYAWELCRKGGATLIALHIFDYPPFVEGRPNDSVFVEAKQEMEGQEEERLRALLEEQLSADIFNVNFRIEVRPDSSAVHGILKMIDECHADLVIMGTTGGNRLRELLIGSTAKGVIEHAPCPVLAIPADAEYSSLSHMVYASDLEQEDIVAIDLLTEIARLYDARITVLHIGSGYKFDAEEKMRWFEELLRERVEYPHINFELLLGGDIFERLNKYLLTHDPTLIAMLERGRDNWLGRLLHRDLVKRMGSATKVALLSFNKKYLHHFSEMKKAGPHKNEAFRSIKPKKSNHI